MSTLLRYTLSCCVSQVVSTEVPMENKSPQPETVSAGKSSSNDTCKRTPTLASSFLMHSDYTPVFASHRIRCQGLSRRKSEIKSPCTEHYVCTHLQYLHTSTGQISISQNAPVLFCFNIWAWLGFGLEAVLFEKPFGDTCSRSWRGQTKK